MTIYDLFQRDIRRSINGVVKADQLDASSVWQELDEFVVTQELSKHLDTLSSVLLAVGRGGRAEMGKNGIWLSGFFGSGKSHFLKVLSYLLQNDEHVFEGERRRAVDFFADKLEDQLLFAELKRSLEVETETILFNIDTKADHSDGRDALLQVFLRVLNEKQGYSGDHPHIADIERHLDKEGKLAAFHEAFEQEAGASWLEERDAWDFRRDELVRALQRALGQSEKSTRSLVEGSEEHFSLTVENFAEWVKAYLDREGSAARLMFLVDEVGQFIGGDVHLMLNLQTITEQLGTICGGRAWVVVTSQEDLDAVLGDLSSSRQHDFSKIQGRFKTRLSLSSANVDEVLKKRLLEKREDALPALREAYEGKHDILRNQLSFLNAGRTFKTFVDSADFADCYPFAPYQFALVQRVFESIRKAGATGLHLSRGERSTLDAFQNAAKQVGEGEIGGLVPFYRFYPSVEGFLDTAVKATIDQASDSHALEPFDVTILKLLFLIRYIDELPGNVDNLVTLCVDEIDTDRLALRKKIESSLARLESETLIARNGELYFFLTNEERDIGREIKGVTIPSGAEERELGKMIFEELLGDTRKHTYRETGRDFPFNRICDDQVVGQKLEGNLEIVFVSPLGENYAEYSTDAKCVLETTQEVDRALVRLPDDPAVGRELRVYLQTESYVRTKQTGTLPDTTKRILRDRSEDNRARRGRILQWLKQMMAEASYFASGRKLEIERSDPKVALGEALESLIKNAFPKMGFIKHLHPNPKQEIQSILRANDLDQGTLGELAGAESNPEAMDDLREYLRLSALRSQQVVLYELIEKRYGRRPYGWPEMEVVLLVARLAVTKEINLQSQGAALALDAAYEHLTTSSKQRQVVISQREVPDEKLLSEARALGKSLFAKQGPAGEEALYTFIRDSLAAWDRDLGEYAPLAQTGRYPGASEIEDARTALRPLVEERESLRFLKRFVEKKDVLRDLADDVTELRGFYKNQKHSWEQLRSAVREIRPNRMQIDADDRAGPALARMEEILAAPRPYSLLREVADLIHTAREVNDDLIQKSKEPALEEIRRLSAQIESELDRAQADDALRKVATTELQKLRADAEQAVSIPHIGQAKAEAQAAFDRAMASVEKAQAEKRSAEEDENVVAPPIKPRHEVEVRSLWSGGFIETSEQVTEFLDKLRRELDAALEAGKRIQLK